MSRNSAAAHGRCWSGSGRLPRRRLLRLLPAAPMAATACAGLGPLLPATPSPVRPVAIVYPANQEGGLPLLAAKATARSGIPFELQAVTLGGADQRSYAAHVDTSARMRGVDLVFLDQASFRPLADTGLLRDLGPLLRNEAWLRAGSFWPTALRAGSLRGQQLAVPFQLAVDLLLYSAEAFAAAGLGPPAAGWTWDQLFAAARVLTRPAPPDGEARWGFLATADAPHLFGLAWQNGATVVDEAGRVGLTEPETLGALELLADMVGRQRVSPPLEPGRPSGLGPRTEVGSGYAAMTGVRVTGPVHWWRLGGSARLEIAELPGGQHAVAFGTSAVMLGLTARSPQPERAVQALRALGDASPDTLWPPARAGGVALRQANTQMSANDEAVLLAALAKLHALPGAVSREALALVRDEVVAPVLARRKRPADAVREGQALLDRAARRG